MNQLIKKSNKKFVEKTLNKPMNTFTYLKTLLNTSGHMNINKLKSTENHPDYVGFIKLDNKIYKISGWFKNQKDTISLRMIEYENNPT